MTFASSAKAPSGNAPEGSGKPRRINGVEVGEHFHEDLLALRALAPASLAAVEYAVRQAEHCPRCDSPDLARHPALTGGMPEPALMAGTPQLDFST